MTLDFDNGDVFCEKIVCLISCISLSDSHIHFILDPQVHFCSADSAGAFGRYPLHVFFFKLTITVPSWISSLSILCHKKHQDTSSDAPFVPFLLI